MSINIDMRGYVNPARKGVEVVCGGDGRGRIGPVDHGAREGVEGARGGGSVVGIVRHGGEIGRQSRDHVGEREGYRRRQQGSTR